MIKSGRGAGSADQTRASGKPTLSRRCNAVLSEEYEEREGGKERGIEKNKQITIMSFNVPLNQVGSVRMEMAAAPPLAYFPACSAALMFGAIIPLLGDALNERRKRGRGGKHP